MRRALLLVWLLATACGSRSVMFAGDSNTHFLPCAYPTQWQAAGNPARRKGYDEGINGSAASDFATARCSPGSRPTTPTTS